MSSLKKRKLNGRVLADAPAKRPANSSLATKSKPAPPTHKPRKAPEPQSEPSENSEDDFQGFSDDAAEDRSSSDSNKGDAQEQNPDSVQSTAEAPKKTFAELGIREELCEACENLNYKHATPVQEQSIPLALSGRDIIGLAETGSGKTAAFVLPILQSLMERPQPCFGLVLAPTRELAYQITQAAEALGSVINVRCATLVGGMDMVPQAIALSKRPHLIVATPGRLLDHLENTKGFSLKKLQYLVMDEADRLLDLDFGPILDKILKVLPRQGRHTYLFSATMSSKVEGLQRASLQNPVRVSISSSSHQVVSTLMQRWIFIPHKHKDVYLIYICNDYIGQPTIIFTRTINETQRVSILLRTLGFGAIPLHGGLSQSARLGALSKFRSRSRDILVATDVAARGLDIPSVNLVVNFDMPSDSQTYVHRVGRTARAGKSGKAITVVTQYDTEILQRIEKALGKQIDEEHMPKDEVMVLMDRVSEAQRVAVGEMKDLHESRGKGRGAFGRMRGKRHRDEMDREEG